MREEEKCAAQLLQKIFGGQVLPRDVPDPPSRSHDFDLQLPNNTLIGVEVTTVTDQQARQFWAAVSKKHRTSTLLSHSWLLDVTKEARVKAIYETGECILARLEKNGVREFECTQGQADPNIEQLKLLGINRGKAFDWGKPSAIYIISSTEPRWVSPAALVRAVKREACKRDNREKLQKACCSERHLFVWIDAFAFEAAAAMEVLRRWKDTNLPDVKLPPEINVVWIASRTTAGAHVWQYDRCGGWQQVGNVDLPCSRDEAEE